MGLKQCRRYLLHSMAAESRTELGNGLGSVCSLRQRWLLVRGNFIGLWPLQCPFYHFLLSIVLLFITHHWWVNTWVSFNSALHRCSSANGVLPDMGLSFRKRHMHASGFSLFFCCNYVNNLYSLIWWWFCFFI